MKSIFAPSMRLLAGGLVLAAAAVDSGCAAAKPRLSRSADALIEELGAPNGKGFDDIVVQLAPLVPAKPAKDARPPQRPPAPEAGPEAPAVSAAASPPKPAPIAPIFLREPLPVIDGAPAEGVAKSAEPSAVPATPNMPAAVAAPAPVDAPVETVAEAPVGTKPDAPVEASREAAGRSEPAQIAEREKSEPAAVAEAETPSAEAEPVPAEAEPFQAEAKPLPAEIARPSAEEPPAQEESESPLALWQELVAALAIVGLLAMKYARRAPAPSKAAASKPAPANSDEGDGDAAGSGGKRPFGGYAAFRARIDSLRAQVEAVRAKIARLRGRRPAADRQAAPTDPPKDAPKKPKTLDWAEIATALRQRLGGAKPAAEPVAHEPSRVISLVETEPRGKATEAWEASEEDGPELLEPGDASARAIVMSARRRLRSAQS